MEPSGTQKLLLNRLSSDLFSQKIQIQGIMPGMILIIMDSRDFFDLSIKQIKHSALR